MFTSLFHSLGFFSSNNPVLLIPAPDIFVMSIEKYISLTSPFLFSIDYSGLVMMHLLFFFNLYYFVSSPTWGCNSIGIGKIFISKASTGPLLLASEVWSGQLCCLEQGAPRAGLRQVLLSSPHPSTWNRLAISFVFSYSFRVFFL